MRTSTDADPGSINTAKYAGAIAIAAILLLIAIRLLLEKR